MARPTKEAIEKRQERFNIRFTLTELEHLRTQAARAGIPPYEFVRRRAIGYVMKAPPRRADSDVLFELNRIGVNVNQLTRAMNAGKEFRGEWQDLTTELRRVLDKVAAAYGS